MSETQVLSVQSQDDAIVATVTCSEFDHTATERFKVEFDAAAKASPMLPMVLDLSKVLFMASMTLGALVEMRNNCHQNKRRFVLACVSPEIVKLMKISALDRLFDIASDVPTALGSPE